jgi:DNA-binding CsgD family transcriptional regulator
VLEQAADALAGLPEPDGGTAQDGRTDGETAGGESDALALDGHPVDAPFAEVDGARSYAHLAGLLPRALERVVPFDAGAAVVQRPTGELVVDVDADDPALAELVRRRALQLHEFLTGGIEADESRLPPAPPAIRSGLYFPLVADGVVVGTTYIASVGEHAFTAEDERVLAELASHASRAFARVDGEVRALRATPRQVQVLALVAEGLSDKEIAEKLGVSPRTVRTHLERVRREHGLASRTEAATAWLRGQRS